MQTQKNPHGAGQKNTNHTANYSPIDQVLPMLDGAKNTGPNKWLARCPAHDDKHPSLSVGLAPSGAVLLKCWAGCEAVDVCAAIGLKLRDLFPHDERGPVYTPANRGKIRLSASEVLAVLRHELVGVHVCAIHMERGEFTPEIKALLGASSKRLALILSEGDL